MQARRRYRMSMGEPCVPGCAVGVYYTGRCWVFFACLPRWASGGGGGNGDNNGGGPVGVSDACIWQPIAPTGSCSRGAIGRMAASKNTLRKKQHAAQQQLTSARSSLQHLHSTIQPLHHQPSAPFPSPFPSGAPATNFFFCFVMIDP